MTAGDRFCVRCGTTLSHEPTPGPESSLQALGSRETGSPDRYNMCVSCGRATRNAFRCDTCGAAFPATEIGSSVSEVSAAVAADQITPARANPNWWRLAFFVISLLVSAILTVWFVSAGRSPYEPVNHGNLSLASRRVRVFLGLLQFGEKAVVTLGYAVSGFAIPLMMVLVAIGIAQTLKWLRRDVPQWLSLGAPAVVGWWMGSVAATLVVGFHASPEALSGTWTQIADSATAAQNEDAFLPRDTVGEVTFWPDGREKISFRSPSQGVGMEIEGHYRVDGKRLTFTADGGTGIDGAPIKLDDLQILNHEISTPDEVLRLTGNELVLRDTVDQSVTHLRRAGD